jgi:hypothetical protein
VSREVNLHLPGVSFPAFGAPLYVGEEEGHRAGRDAGCDVRGGGLLCHGSNTFAMLDGGRWLSIGPPNHFPIY